MKCLSVKQPWAALIVSGIKDVENRSWPTSYRGRILIHAAKQPDRLAVLPKFKGTVLPRVEGVYGAIIGSVEVVDCVRDHASRWAQPDQWHWLLRDAEPCIPVPYTGSMKLFDVEWPSLAMDFYAQRFMGADSGNESSRLHPIKR